MANWRMASVSLANRQLSTARTYGYGSLSVSVTVTDAVRQRFRSNERLAVSR